MAINLELERLYEEDKKERWGIKNGDHNGIAILKVHTVERIQKVKRLLSIIDSNEIWNCHYIAYLLQHGDTAEDYQLAHDYAKKAVAMGSKVTKWLYAATLDRVLVSQGKKQKYGTQFIQKNGQWELLPIEETTTDEERKEYYVPPVTELLQKFIEKYKQD